METSAGGSEKGGPSGLITGSSGESASITTISPNRVFEKFYFCKQKIIDKGDGRGVVRKNFWVFPPVDGEKVTKEEQGEADILSGFCFQKMTATDPAMDAPVVYIAEFFTKFRASNARKFWFVLSQNMKQDAYVNEYNPGGVRNFFGMSFDDFELVPETNRLIKTQGLFLIESKFPFRTFMFKMLEIIFDLVRVFRLSEFAANFNGDSRDLSNLKRCSLYDSSRLVEVIQKQSTGFLSKLILEQGDRQIVASEEQFLSIKHTFKPDALMADFYEAVESKILITQVFR